MAKSLDIITRLIATVPKLTNLFSDTVNISSLTCSGNTVTAITATPHGLTTGNYITISGAQAPVQIIELTSSNGVAYGTTAQPHDLTKAPEEPYTPPIKVTGADQPEYNGNALTLLSVPNRFTFTYQISGNPVSPATGALILLFDGRERGYNGKQQITVVDANTFTYEISGSGLLPAIGTITAQVRYRISGGVTKERCIEAYARQNEIAIKKLWAFVVLDDMTTSKDRAVLSDGTYTPTVGVRFQQREIQQFHIFTITPCTGEIAARNVRDLMEDVRIIFYKAILKFRPPSGLIDQNPFGIAFLGHGTHEYDNAYYVHRFSFEISCDITEEDLLVDDNVAFRDLDFTITNSPNELITNEVNLDDYPI